MSANLVVSELSSNDWNRLRELRLASLRHDGSAFGGNLEAESEFTEANWREKFTKLEFIVASIDGLDIAIMSVEKMNGDFGATCWVGGCWVEYSHRNKGALRAMFDFLDKNAESRNWQVQGLGVWIDNFAAISAYKKLGFVEMGEPQMSTRKPGLYYQRMIRKTSQ
jgi:RimJ/RimL family protein N-acetyltransferase